jgi:apolipoprotein D and lipocalin family protein
MLGDFVIAVANAARRRLHGPDGPPPRPVAHVDLTRYLGRWYEVARKPNPEEDGRGRRAVDVVATYMPRADGTVTVHNVARDAGRDGRPRSITGRARALDETGAKLKVIFFHLFGGDYWVLGLDPDYRWAVVGTPSRRRLWLLSRTPRLEPAEYDRCIAIAVAQGYAASEIVPTPQSAA